MPGQAGDQLADRAHGRQDDARVVFATLDEAQVEPGVVSKVVSNQGAPLSGGITKVIFVWEPSVTFCEGVGGIVATRPECFSHLEIDVLVQVNTNS